VPIEVTPPKYAVVANTIQQRILDGTYAPGSKLPSETQLTEEFDTSRPMVVRALEFLKQEGWIESHQGKGRFVRGRPSLAGRHAPAYVGGLLDEEERAKVELLQAGPVLAPNRAAAALGIRPGTPVICRKRIVVAAEVGPVELSSVFIPVNVASGTDVDTAAPLAVGLLRHLAQVKGVVFDHATQRISARHATAEEAKHLQIARRDVVLTLLLTVHDRSGAAQLCVDAVLPASRHELEDAFPLS
jgi:GntR family transcriptional regulator